MCASLVALSQALLTPVIAIVATYIAWQQWKANELKLRLERYERRLAIYREVVKTITIVMRDANIKTADLVTLMAACPEADFLFGAEIRQYIDEIFHRGLKLSSASSQYRDLTQEKPAGYDHMAIVNEMESHITWFMEQHKVATAKFKQYLDLSK